MCTYYILLSVKGIILHIFLKPATGEPCSLQCWLCDVRSAVPSEILLGQVIINTQQMICFEYCLLINTEYHYMFIPEHNYQNIPKAKEKMQCMSEKNFRVIYNFPHERLNSVYKMCNVLLCLFSGTLPAIRVKLMDGQCYCFHSPPRSQLGITWSELCDKPFILYNFES